MLKDRNQSIQEINELASQQVPFVFIISFDSESNYVYPLTETTKHGIYFETPVFRNHSLTERVKDAISISSDPVDLSKYNEAFQEIMSHIRYGNTFLLNLTFPTPISCNYSLRDIFSASRAMFKLIVEDQFVVFSPERFVRTQDGTISSNPMKGTIDASEPNAYSLLQSDRKEDAEHNTIVDLIRNDLGMVAKEIRVKRFKYIDRIQTHAGELLQMSSEISGKLPVDYRKRLGDILFRLLPAGSVTGAPKAKTVSIIQETENYERGFYTGVFGYFDGKELDSSVIIRYIEKHNKGFLFKSGGGITHMSNMEDEYREMIHKVYVPVY